MKNTLSLYMAWTTKYKEPLCSMCFECGKTNATKVEVDKHLMFHTGKNSVVNHVEWHLHQFLSHQHERHVFPHWPHYLK